MNRKAIPKSVRFEVFKRDKFTCQYCGAKAPDVVLHLDHVHPVAEGGGDDILNLIAACQDCNGGKGKRLLSDDTAVTKQRDQLEALQERREQLDMMIEWRRGLSTIEDDQALAISGEIDRLTGFSLSSAGLQRARRYIKRYGFEVIFEAVGKCAARYAHLTGEDAFEKVWATIPRCAGVLKDNPGRPWIWDLLYIKGIVRNRCGDEPGYDDDATMSQMVGMVQHNGVPISDLSEAARTCVDWSDWWRMMGGLDLAAWDRQDALARSNAASITARDESGGKNEEK